MRRPTEARLRLAFSEILTSMLATAAMTAACSGGAGEIDPSSDGGADGGTLPPSTPGFTSLCKPYQSGSTSIVRPLLSVLTSTPPLDGAERRYEEAFFLGDMSNTSGVGAPGPETGDGWTTSTSERAGNMCATASNRTACLEKVQGFRLLPATREACAAKFPGGYRKACTTSYVLYTRGDEIGVAQTNEEMKALIGTFDVLEEALSVATDQGYQVSCAYSTGNNPPDSEYRQTSSGEWDFHLVQSDNCGSTTYALAVHVDYAGNLTVVSKTDLGIKPGCAVAGRRPAGFAEDAAGCADAPAAGQYFASMATLEAASVVAFRKLHRELAAFGAPRELLDRIRKAARDEIRHARATTALAKKFGATPHAPSIAKTEGQRSLAELARENAREGCVRETYGALVAHAQARSTTDDHVREAMRAIADEETEHAALSWDIASWIEAQLTAGERAELARERRAAIVALSSELGALDASMCRVTGVPSAREALALLDGLAPMLLAA